MRYTLKPSILALGFVLALTNSHAQPGTTVDLKKPEQYENRQLRSEKTGEKKLSAPKRILQNTFTHYNYFFNANNKLNQVLDRAKSAHEDDYTQLLPFYNYSLDVTAGQRNEIDSVIYKCTAGILLHDLRNDWIDNLYLLLGKAYMFRKDFDSATHTFQYINYAYAPKDEGYDLPIGSNSSNTGGEFTIATKETKNALKKLVTHPPSRNESFIWQARNFVEQGELSDAAGLIEILRNDPHFPKRLDTELHEVVAYWFYHQQAWDSAAHYLVLALGEADTRQDRARWEYLAGQMYALAGKNDLAIRYFGKAIDHTIDPVLEVYARLNSIRIANSGRKENQIEDNINDLVRMAKKDKYENYKDIIYFTAAKAELERKNIPGAIKWLKKSVEAGSNNPNQKAESFLLLADLSYDSRDYVSATRYYDSVSTDQLKKATDQARVNQRKPALLKISDNIQKINEQDSLQRVANMPLAEREDYIRQVVRRLRKAKGLKDEPSTGSNNVAGSGGNKGTDAFSNTKADWYFANPSLKAKGYSEFKSVWGNRPNVDNWRRQQAVDRTAGAMPTATGQTSQGTAVDTSVISYESLLARLPLTPAQLEASNGIIRTALLENGKTFHETLEDWAAAVEVYEEILRRFPTVTEREEALFGLVYLYGKLNNQPKAEAARQQLQREFPSSKYVQMLNQAAAGGNTGGAPAKSDAATRKYQEIYELFLSGRFEAAKEEKLRADQQYGNSYWTPQLLFIESIYYIKQKQDSTAINRLNTIITQFGSSPLAEKATTMIDVLSRRKEIEAYLTRLDVDRKEDEQVQRVDPPQQQTTAVKPVEPKQDVTSKPVVIDKAAPVKIDTLVTKPTVISSAGGFRFSPADQHYAAVVLDNVDGMYIGEVRNAFNRYNTENFYRQVIRISTEVIDDRYTLVLLGPFKDAADAVDYVDKTRPAASSRIMPWLSAEKFGFLIINNTNLTLLKESKDLPAYRKLITETLPGKF